MTPMEFVVKHAEFCRLQSAAAVAERARISEASQRSKQRHPPQPKTKGKK